MCLLFWHFGGIEGLIINKPCKQHLLIFKTKVTTGIVILAWTASGNIFSPFLSDADG